MATAQPQKKVEELEVLQEDDEFEEFEGGTRKIGS
jgi:hypothetical protein